MKDWRTTKCPTCGTGDPYPLGVFHNRVGFRCGGEFGVDDGKIEREIRPCGQAIPSENAWKLWHSMFTDGEQVVVATVDDELEWGALRTTDHGVELTRPRRRAVFIWWEDITLIAHDGFPVRKLVGADGSKLALRLDTSKPEEAIRRALSHRPRHMRAIGYGDPFLIEGVDARLANPGCRSWEHFYEDREEQLVMTARDGAHGILGGLESVFVHDLHPAPPLFEMEVFPPQGSAARAWAPTWNRIAKIRGVPA